MAHGKRQARISKHQILNNIKIQISNVPNKVFKHVLNFEHSNYVENSLSRAYNESIAPGYPGANRREARKLGLLRSKSSEAERERTYTSPHRGREGEALRAYARRGGDVSLWNSSPDAMLILDTSFSFFEGAAHGAAWVIVQDLDIRI